MKVLTPGHKYSLSSFEDKDSFQQLQFIEKAPDPESEGKLITINDGTTNEEVIEMLIDRISYLNSKFPCRENSIAITRLEEALLWLEKRTKDRIARKVEGKHMP